MKKQASADSKSSLVRIREVLPQKYVTDTNKDEKTQTPILDIQALKTISRIVWSIKRRLEPDSGNAK
jgi:hypothetical protein